jgi:ParB/RepB/Spo0J family partition protein
MKRESTMIAHNKSVPDAWQHLEDELTLQRTIEALLPTRQTTTAYLSLDHIRPNPFQARLAPEPAPLLVQEIRSHGLGIRLRVRPAPNLSGSYQLMFGGRWLNAARAATLSEVPCEVGVYTDDELLEIGLVEQVARGELEPLEEAFALRMILEQRAWTPAHLAIRIGKEHSYVLQRLALLGWSAPASANGTAPAAMDQPPQAQPAVRGAQPGMQMPPDQNRRMQAPVSSASRVAALSDTTHTRRIIDNDIHTLRMLFARWRSVLARQQDEQHLIFSYLDELISEVKHLEDRRP